MTGRHVAVVALAAALVVAALTLAAGVGIGPVLVAVLGVVMLGGALVSGYPVLVVLAALCQVGSVAWTVGVTGEWTGVAVAAPAAWLAAEAGWRALVLGCRVVVRESDSTEFIFVLLCFVV